MFLSERRGLMLKINIRPFGTDDIKEACIIEKKCFSEPWSEKSFKNALENGFSCFFAAEHMGKLIGYAGMYTVLGEGYIYNIAVEENYRHHGIGRALTEKLLEYSKNKNLDFLSLEVRTSNKFAICLYEKCGFKKIGVRKNFYSFPKEDGIIMTCYL